MEFIQTMNLTMLEQMVEMLKNSSTAQQLLDLEPIKACMADPTVSFVTIITINVTIIAINVTIIAINVTITFHNRFEISIVQFLSDNPAILTVIWINK